METNKVFLEGGELEAVYDAGGLLLSERRVFLPGSQWLSYYQYGWSPLYLDKKGFAAHLCDEMEKKFLYLAEARSIKTLAGYGFSRSSLKSEEEDTETDDLDEDIKAEYYEKIQELRRELREVDSELEEKLSHHEDFWDFKERWENNSLYTNRERYIRGMASMEEYYGEDVFRSYKKADIEFDAFQEKSNLEYQIRQLENELETKKEALRQKKREKQAQKVTAQLADMRERKSYVSKLVASVSVQAELIFHDEKLMAIYVPQQPGEAFEITADGGWEFRTLKGHILNFRETEGGKADSRVLYHFLMENYGSSMKTMKKVPLKPERLSEEEWSMWIGLRQAQQPD